jgi:AraC-like DNA-binding protein
VIKPTVFIQPSVVIIYGYSLDAFPHSHRAIQVIWPQSVSPCKLNGNNVSGAIIIDSKIKHQLQMSEGWVLLIEPKSDLGQKLSNKLAGEPLKIFSSRLCSVIKAPVLAEDLPKFLTPLLDELNLTSQSLFLNKNTISDRRIQQLLTELDKCLLGDCIKPANWRAAEISNQLALSESRFLHLFSQELGIAWRPYLLWCRLTCAIRAMVNNASATDAAHLAGFSDSAHLSRTFRNTFGMTIRQAHAIFVKT